jgi:tetratricopeptide (TPR) repeat protein
MELDELIHEGQVLLSEKKFEEAAARFAEAIAADPENHTLHTYRGAALMAAAKHADALADFDKAIALNPGQPRLHYRRGMARMALLDFAGAVADFSRAIEIDPQYGVAFYSRGMAYDSLGREEEAQQDMRSAYTLGTAKMQGELDTYGIIRTEMDRNR